MQRFFVFMVLCLLVAGCGPKLTPVLAEQELSFDIVANQAHAAQIGESMISGQEQFSLPAFSPFWGTTLRLPDGSRIAVSADQPWTAVVQLDDGSFILEPMHSVAGLPAGLGLRVDATGSIFGNKPWFDLHRKTRVSQPFWDGLNRLLFKPTGMLPVDVFVFELRYRGMHENSGVLDHVDFKQVGVKGGEARQRLVRESEVFRVHSLDIRIFGLYPDHVRYVVEDGR